MWFQTMAERMAAGDKTPEPKSACNWVDENIWAPLSDAWNTKTVKVNPAHFVGLPDSITIPQISICNQATGKMVSRTGEKIEHYSEASRRYVPPR